MRNEALDETKPASNSAPRAVDADLPSLSALGNEQRLEAGELIGRGGMGEVRRVGDVRLGRELAMKTSTADDAESRQRFVREARVQGQLEHPGIVPVHELGLDTDGRPFFTMKRVRGITLYEVLRDGTFPRRRLLTFLQSLARTLDFAHARGVVHRDVKPSNVMLGDFGEVYLLDWGLAKLHTTEATSPSSQAANAPGQTMAGAVMGTPGYMAPEQAAGRTASSASDVWALGVMLYEALTNTRLIDGETAVEALMLTQQLREPSPRAVREDVSPELDALCRAALAHEESQRPSAREFAERLDAVLAGERDSELRASLAQRHVERAEAAAALVMKDGSLDARREALREVGQALALDPSLTRAHDVFGQLLALTPAELPPELKHEHEEAYWRSERAGLRNALYGNALTSLIFLFVLPWVRNWSMVAVSGALWLIATGYVWWLLRRSTRTTRPQRVVGIVLAASFISCLSLVSGPFIILPPVATAYAMSLASWVPKPERLFAVTVQCGTLAVPLMLSVVGVLPPFFSPHPDGVVLRAQMFDFDPHGWMPATAATLLASVVMAAMATGRVRRELDEGREALALQRWNLEQLRAAAPK